MQVTLQWYFGVYFGFEYTEFVIFVNVDVIRERYSCSKLFASNPNTSENNDLNLSKD